MPSWLSTWLSWSTIGASGFVGLGLLAAAVDGLARGGSYTPLAMVFGGLGLCTLSAGLLKTVYAETGL